MVEKDSYNPPELKTYGTVEEITRGGRRGHHHGRHGHHHHHHRWDHSSRRDFF